MDNLILNDSDVETVELQSSSELTTNQTANFFSKLGHSDFSILHANIRSLTKNLDKLKDLLNICDFEPKAIAISETWLSGDKHKIVQLPNYVFLHFDRAHKTGGGVALYVHCSLRYRMRNDINLSIDSKCDSLWVELVSRGFEYLIG